MTADDATDISMQPHGAWTVVRVQGDLDMATAPGLESTAAGLEGPVALDVSRVAFIDSSGLRGLLRVRDMHGSVVLIAPSAVVRRLLDLTSLSDAFEVVEDATALEATT